MIELDRRDDLDPLCPHCRTEQKRLFFRELRGALGKRYLYFCSACRAIVGVSHRKGFFMG
ncbi:MAG: hypothetical protein DWQ36_14955 [Acidobacteria bacterium]|nr:MAG: hypothetical protein DWQ30_00055 [Acidobacteriota bacterium]REK06190.1 MAG: hypothetical protein DWQ36_14955 [Acidobacteriota bacterium]